MYELHDRSYSGNRDKDIFLHIYKYTLLFAISLHCITEYSTFVH